MNIPLALVGAVIGLWLSGQPLSVAALVGFITLAGISVRNGILKVSHYINLMRMEGESFDHKMILRGSLERLSPVLMTALAAGNADAARSHAGRADRLLGTGPLTLLMRAQAAQLAGEEAAAGQHYAAMTALPEGEFLGLRGLLGQAMRRSDVEEARRLLARAAQLAPKSRWVNQTRFDLECAAGNWNSAAEILAHAGKALGEQRDAGREVAVVVRDQDAHSGRADSTVLI